MIYLYICRKIEKRCRKRLQRPSNFSFYHRKIATTTKKKKKKKLSDKDFDGAVLMDLSKAFDTLNHELLIAKLHAYGFNRDSFKLRNDYLSNRWQRTKTNKSFSS